MFFKVKLTAQALFVTAVMSLVAQRCADAGTWAVGLSLDLHTVFSDPHLNDEAGRGKRWSNFVYSVKR